MDNHVGGIGRPKKVLIVIIAVGMVWVVLQAIGLWRAGSGWKVVVLAAVTMTFFGGWLLAIFRRGAN